MPQATSAEIRSTLVDALQIDLVGPKPDDTEHAKEILTQAPSKWYLTGFLAPFGAKPDDRSDDEADVEPQELGDGATSEDSQSPEATPARKALFPASMGMSFLIAQQTKELLTTIHWGDYEPIEPEEQNLEVEESGDKKKRKPERWQRIPKSVSLSVPIQANKDSFEIELPGGSGLTLVVNCRPVIDHRFEAGTLSVSIFLVNYRQMLSSEKDRAFAFQTCLIVQCPEGFVPRSDLRGLDSSDPDEAIASLQYRHEYEFAVGHNASVIADSSNSHSCTEVCTTWIPIAEVPRVEPAPLPMVQLGMEALAAADSVDVIQQMLNPMVTEYRTWIAAQSAAPIDPPQANKVAQALLNDARRACDRIEAGINVLSDPNVLGVSQK